MKQKNNLILAKEWFEKADDDELSCQDILKEGGASSTLCFLYYIESRYPSDSSENFSWEESKAAFKYSREIKDTILNSINNG